MEYIFGTEIHRGVTVEVVKVKSDRPVELSGSFSVERKYTDAIITDNFIVVGCIRRKDKDGVFYAWYEIKNHCRYIDKFTPGIGPVIEPVVESIDDTQDALCEASEDFDSRIADIEDALCELTEV